MEAGVLDWSRDGKIIVALGAKELSNIFGPRDPSTNDFWFVYENTGMSKNCKSCRQMALVMFRIHWHLAQEFYNLLDHMVGILVQKQTEFNYSHS